MNMVPTGPGNREKSGNLTWVPPGPGKVETIDEQKWGIQ